MYDYVTNFHFAKNKEKIYNKLLKWKSKNVRYVGEKNRDKIYNIIYNTSCRV